MKDWFRTEDGWAVWIGLLIFALTLGVLGGTDSLGWAVSTKEWSDPAKAAGPRVGAVTQVFPAWSVWRPPTYSSSSCWVSARSSFAGR